MADLLLREFDVVDRLRCNLGDERRDLVRGQAKARRRPFVKAIYGLAHCGIAALSNIDDDGLDRAPDLRVGLFLLAGERRRFNVSRHRPSYSITSFASARSNAGTTRPSALAV